MRLLAICVEMLAEIYRRVVHALTHLQSLASSPLCSHQMPWDLQSLTHDGVRELGVLFMRAVFTRSALMGPCTAKV